jgi:hypothetical protein
MKDSLDVAKFLGDGKRIMFFRQEGNSKRMYLMSLDTGEVTPALAQGVFGFVISPDGKYVVGSGPSDTADKIYALAGGPSRTISGISGREWVVAWEPLPYRCVWPLVKARPSTSSAWTQSQVSEGSGVG